jgi:hypothetical protein
MRLITVLVVLSSGVFSLEMSAQQPRAAVDNVLVVTLDGLRWQELFGGAQRELISKNAGGVADTLGLRQQFWKESAETRREALMPFLWSVVSRRGVVLGDSAGGSTVRVTNGKRFSYPGYNELLTGSADDRIDSNDKVPNPNVTVLEWLNRRPSFRGKVAAFGSWDVLPYIVNRERSGLYANGDAAPVTNPRTAVERALNDLAADLPPYWGTVRFDGVTMQGALNYLRTRQPRVLYVMLGDTDEWAHERRYDLYLDAAHRGDRFLRTLWETVQAMPGYRGRTALLIATDHGRGSGNDWTDHGRDVPDAGRIWMAMLRPGAAPNSVNGQRSTVNGNYTQSQFAATIAGLLGLEKEFRAANPKAAGSFPSP